MRENEGGVDMALIKCPECGKEIIINGTYFTGYVVLGMGALIIAAITGVASLKWLIEENEINRIEKEDERKQDTVKLPDSNISTHQSGGN